MIKNILRAKVFLYGEDILSSGYIERERHFIQHGKTSVLEHSFNVACISLWISYILKIKTDERAMVRGALLHDYFLYDWHIKGECAKYHGFTHAKTALINAKRDFCLDALEENIIERHMFPLNIVPPKYREGVIVCIADKICALAECFGIKAMMIDIYRNFR